MDDVVGSVKAALADGKTRVKAKVEFPELNLEVNAEVQVEHISLTPRVESAPVSTA